LLEVDRNGHVAAEYWNNGYIESVSLRSWRGGAPALFVGGTNNETKDASLAVFFSGHANGSAPATQPRYRCNTCPEGEPDTFIVFPRRGVALTVDRQATVQELRVEQNSTLHVNVGEASRGSDGWFAYSAWYQFDDNLRLTGALLPDGFKAAYQTLLEAGQVRKPFGQQVESELFPVRRWNGSVFVELPAVPVTR